VKASSTPPPQPALDRPLETGSAVKGDKLDREAFARSAVSAIKKANSLNGLVLSIEGAWGSGKTSALAMIEELLGQDESSPTVVRFNPWLVGDRDTLLRHFLAKLAEAAKLSDNAKAGKKAAKELKSYAKVFDVVKLLPGAEPWASLVKSVIENVGDATDSIAEYKTPDIELHKTKVEGALKKLDHQIVVFIDDIDRLFPLEVFEMIRIIKAVGDLPNVAYVVAWDHRYVSDALGAASVPQSSDYLDKIVQIRMPLPALSLMARNRLVNDAIASLHEDATRHYFPRSNERISSLYFSGLREILEQPRDVIRVFNTVEAIEPALRGEIVFADIVALAALMVKAPVVFELLRRHPRWFVGLLPGDSSLLKKAEEWIADGAGPLQAAIDGCAAPDAVKAILKLAFPASAGAAGRFSFNRVVEVEGHIAAPARLIVALQMSISGSDVSIVMAKRYLVYPDQREAIEKALTSRNCSEFLEYIGQIGRTMEPQSAADFGGLALSISRMVDTAVFVQRGQERSFLFWNNPEQVAENALESLVAAMASDRASKIAESIIEDPSSISMGMHLVMRSYLNDERHRDTLLLCSPPSKARLVRKLAANILAAAQAGTLFSINTPGFVLWNLVRFAPTVCPKIFASIAKRDPTLDEFALAFFQRGFDSTKGQTYQVPEDKATVEAFAPLDMLRAHAKVRLADSTLTYPTRAAWKAADEGKAVYGVDGTYASR